MDNSYAPESALHGNDAFASKLLSARLSAEQSSRFGYFCDEQCVVPFIWEEQPGIPKDPPTQHFVPPVVPPPAKLRPLRGPKPASTQSRSCFFEKPRRTLKPKKVQMVLQGHHAILDESREFGHSESSISEDDLFSSPRGSKSWSLSSRDSPASSKGFVFLSSKLGNLAKGILRRFF